jgi:hypothetical protein
MPTRLYLRNTAATQAGRPVGTATTDEDLGHLGVARLICLIMSRAKGNANYNVNLLPNAVTPHAGGDSCLIRMFLSPALAGQTLAAGETFTHAVGFNTGGGEIENYCRGFVYLWRPGVGYVATLFGDAASRTGVNDGSEGDPGTIPIWRVKYYDALTGDVEVRLRDRIVFEAWHHVTAETAGHPTYFHYNGSDDAHEDGESVDPADCASYLEYSGDLVLAGEVSMNSANILVGARDLQVDGANVGALDGGVTVTYEPTHVEHTVDQRMGVQRVDRVAERMTISANLKEATLENLRIAWGLPSYALSTSGTATVLNVGGEEAVTEHTLVLTGKAPGADRTRSITCHKAVAIDTSAHSYTKEDATIYPVTFVLVEDAAQGAGFRYVTIEDDDGQFNFA